MWNKKGNYDDIDSVSEDFTVGGLPVISAVQYKIYQYEPLSVVLSNHGDGVISIIAEISEASTVPLKEKIKSGNFPGYQENCAPNFAFTAFQPSEQYRVVELLHILKEFMPIDSIAEEILKTFKIKPIHNEEEFYNSLETLIQSNQISECFKQIEQVPYIQLEPDVYFKFANLLKKNEYYLEALDVYQSIDEKNPRFEEANDLAQEILISYSLSTELNIEEKRLNSENLIRLMLRSNTLDKQSVLDRLYSELCGAKDGKVIIQNIAIDEDTIIKLASEVAMLNQRIEKLTADNKQLSKLCSSEVTEHSPKMF